MLLKQRDAVSDTKNICTIGRGEIAIATQQKVALSGVETRNAPHYYALSMH